MKILVVEDEHKIAASVKRGFEQEKWVVDVAFDGEEGYDLAFSGDYDVIVLDLMLPKMTGEEVCYALRSAGKHTPVLMLTAKGELGDKIKGFNIGADDYLVKPFAFEELVARVKALGKRQGQIQGHKLKIRDILLDTKNFEVEQAGKPVELSKKEYLLLEYLMKRGGQIISKEDIIRSVWNYEADILPNTVEVFVSSLRRKIGRDAIKTVRGFGYKMT